MSTITELSSGSKPGRHAEYRFSSNVYDSPGHASLPEFMEGSSPPKQRARSADTFGAARGYSTTTRHALDDQVPLEADEDSSPYEDEEDEYPDDETERAPHAQVESTRLPSDFAEPRLNFPAPPVRAGSLAPRRPPIEDRKSSQNSHNRSREVRQSRLPPHADLGPPSNLRDMPEPYRRPRSTSVSSQSTTDFYRRTAKATDLDFWAPPARVTASLKPDHGPIPNLPDWASMRNTDPTSYPIHHVQRDVEYSITRLVSPAVFEQFLGDRLGRHRFREYMNTFEPSTSELDFMLDVDEHIHAVQNLRKGSEVLHEAYVRDPDSRIDLPPELSADLIQSLRATHGLQHQLEGVHSHLVQSIFNSAFQRFIRASITEQSRVRLGSLATGDEDEDDGLGAAFVLTNPRLRDHPIVLVSPTFCELTGYPQEAILQRNCRFLQGPSTSPASIQRIRDALNTGGSSTELLLNYRRNGEPFWNLLSIQPLRDQNGQVRYFIGGQVNVTGSLTNKGLSFLLGGGRSYETLPDPESTRLYGMDASPTLMRHASSSASLRGDARAMTRSKSTTGDAAVGTARRRMGPQAAGAQLVEQRDFAAPKLAQELGGPGVILSNGGISSSNGGGGGGSSLVKRLLQRRKPTAQSQSLGRTAESEVRRTGGTLEEHMDDFAATYSRLALVKQEKREVLFVTSALLEYFGQP
ncbi:hypothetical protein OC834_006994, partial [Tilletia horrida]